MPRFRSAYVLFFAAVLAFGGCGRPANPLDWRISAETPLEYNNWLAEVAMQMPADTQEEFVHAFDELVVVSGHAGIARGPNDTNDPLCRRLNHRTVREVLLDGYDCETTRLKNRIALDSELLLHDLNSEAASDPRTVARAEAMAKSRQNEIAADKKRLAEIARRVHDLAFPAG